MIAITCLLGLVLVPTRQAKDNDVEQLINNLVNVGKPMAGAHPTAWASEFMALDEEPRFGGGILGSEKPTVDPNMKKLVQLGYRALPALIAHLQDDRKTELTIKHDDGMGAMWFADEYSPRYADPSRQPNDVNKLTVNFRDTISEYTLRVGDLCYVAVGQIVNRGLNALRYQPTLCEVLNSPVHTPALAKAVQRDWGGITESEFIKQLEDDAYGFWPYDAPQASKRMFYYYPPEGEKLIIKLLNRQLCDYGAPDAFGERMMKENDEAKWKELRDISFKKFGPNVAALIPQFIYWDNFETQEDHGKDVQDRASRLLKSTYPNYTKGQPILDKVADLRAQKDLVEGLAAVKSAPIDSAVDQFFLRVMNMPWPGVAGDYSTSQWQFDLDDLSVACGTRMAGKGKSGPYLAYFDKRLKDIGGVGEGHPEWYRAEAMKKCIKLLKSNP